MWHQRLADAATALEEGAPGRGRRRLQGCGPTVLLLWAPVTQVCSFSHLLLFHFLIITRVI